MISVSSGCFTPHMEGYFESHAAMIEYLIIMVLSSTKITTMCSVRTNNILSVRIQSRLFSLTCSYYTTHLLQRIEISNPNERRVMTRIRVLRA